MTVGERVKQARKRRGISQQAVATAAGVSVMTISSLERGRTRSPSAENLEPIAKALDVSPAWLLTGKEADNTGCKHDDLISGSSPIADQFANTIRALSASGEITDAQIDGLLAFLDITPGKVVGLIQKAEKK